MRKKRVLAFGCFDIVHAGHLHYLKKAKALGNELVVIVARDSTMKKEKGRAPLFSEKERLSIISGIKFVDKALLGHEGNRFAIVKELSPDIIALGYDQKPSDEAVRKALERIGVNARVARIKSSLNEKKFKSSRALRVLKTHLMGEI